MRINLDPGLIVELFKNPREGLKKIGRALVGAAGSAALYCSIPAKGDIVAVVVSVLAVAAAGTGVHLAIKKRRALAPAAPSANTAIRPASLNCAEMAFAYYGTVEYDDLAALMIELATRGYLTVNDGGSGRHFKENRVFFTPGRKYDGDNPAEKKFLRTLTRGRKLRLDSLFKLPHDAVNETKKLVKRESLEKQLFAPQSLASEKFTMFWGMGCLAAAVLSLLYVMVEGKIGMLLAMSTSAWGGMLFLYSAMLHPPQRGFSRLSCYFAGIVFSLVIPAVCFTDPHTAFSPMALSFVPLTATSLVLTGIIFYHAFRMRRRTVQGIAAKKRIGVYLRRLKQGNPQSTATGAPWRDLPRALAFKCAGRWLRHRPPDARAVPPWFRHLRRNAVDYAYFSAAILRIHKELVRGLRANNSSKK